MPATTQGTPTGAENGRDALPMRDASISRGSIAVSISLLLAALLGASQALLIAFIVGEGNRTDAFFAAYSLYLAFAIFGSTLRSSLIPLIGPADSGAQFAERAQEVLSRILLLGVVIVTGLALISPIAGQLLTLGLPGYARWTAVFALLILSPAAFLQILGASQAAALMGAKRFYLSSAAFVGAGIVAVAISAALLASLGVLGATIGLLAGAATFTFAQLAYLRRFGVRLRPKWAWVNDARQRWIAAFVLSASAIPISQQLVLAIGLGAISSEPGAITAYSYAFFAVAMLLTVSTLPLSLATMPDLVSDTARRGTEAARDYLLRVAPYGFAVLVPLLVVFVVDAKPVLELVFGSSLSDRTIDTMYEVGVVLCLMGVPASFVYLTSSMLLALERARTFVPIAGIAIALQLVLALIVSGVSPVAVAGAQVIVTAVTAALLLRASLGGDWIAVTLHALRRCGPAFLIALAIVVVRAPFGLEPSAGVAIACAVAGLAIYVALVGLFWRGVAQAFIDLVPSRKTAA